MLEIILIIIGIVAIFAGLYWYAFRKMPFSIKSSKKQRKQIEPQFDNDTDFADIDDSDKKMVTDEEGSINLSIDPEYDDQLMTDDKEDTELDQEIPKPAQQQNEPVKPQPTAIDEYTVIAFTVMAKKGEKFSGKTLKTLFNGLDFHFGEMQFYHRLMDDTDKKTLFSVANILDPGTLNPDTFATMTTPGLLIFARFPSPMNDGELFDEMFKTVRTMAEQLSGVLCDEKRQKLRQTTLEDMRSRIS